MDLFISNSPYNYKPQKKFAENPKFTPNKELCHYQHLLQLVEKELSHFPQSIFTEKAQKYQFSLSISKLKL